HQKKNAVRTLAEIRDVNDVWMTNGCGRAHFAFEAGNRFAFLKHFVIEYVRPDGLHRDATRQEILIARQIDLAHRAAAQSLLEEITRREQPRSGQSVLGVCLVLRTGNYVVFITTFTTWTLAHGRVTQIVQSP